MLQNSDKHFLELTADKSDNNSESRRVLSDYWEVANFQLIKKLK